MTKEQQWEPYTVPVSANEVICNITVVKSVRKSPEGGTAEEFWASDGMRSVSVTAFVDKDGSTCYGKSGGQTWQEHELEAVRSWDRRDLLNFIATFYAGLER